MRAALMFGMFEFQSQLIFPIHAVPRAGPLPPGAEALALTTPDGHKLRGHPHPARRAAAEATLILGFGGNAWNGQDVAEYLHELFPDADVVAFHYRGYAPSTGSPSAEALMADAPLVYDFAVERREARAHDRRRLQHRQRDRRAPRRRAPARRARSWSLRSIRSKPSPRPCIRGFRSARSSSMRSTPRAALERRDVPVAILAAEHDEIVPTERTAALPQRVSEPRLRPHDRPARATTTFTPARISRPRCARRSRRSSPMLSWRGP